MPIINSNLGGETLVDQPMPIQNSSLGGETLIEQPCIELHIYLRRKKDQGWKINLQQLTKHHIQVHMPWQKQVFQPLNHFNLLFTSKSLFSDNSSAENTFSDDLNVLIVVRKGTKVCTKHRIVKHVSYHRLSPTMRAFTTNLSSVEIPKDIQEALAVPGWMH